jgi:hypothetical protein
MNNYCAVLLAILGMALPFRLPAQTNDAELAAKDKEACIQNLKTIYDAIQLYRGDHKDLPHWLSDLVPQYISDPNVLICPVCKRTGKIESHALADPNLPCSYLFEFCPAVLGTNLLAGNSNHTSREWKRRQMGLVGSVVPMVRCRHHAPVLNVSFDGRISEGPWEWERTMSGVVNPADLSARRLFAADGVVNLSVAAARPKPPYPARDPRARPGLIDLTAYYNVPLTEPWQGNPNGSFSLLPTGLQNFAGADYDVRGIVQVGCRAPAFKRFPSRVNGIKIRQKCGRLHFLHSAAFGSGAEEGKQLGSYVLHFAANNMQLEIPILYGRDVRDCRVPSGEKSAPSLKAAWTGADMRLFSTTWVNVAPGVEIESVDFVSSMQDAAPFLIAITAE